LDKPVQRLWLQSMTPQAIRDGFEHLRSDAQMRAWPTPRAAARPTGWWASTARAP
jgi:DNA topoisomerase-3